MRIMKVINWFFRRRIHKHLVEVADMAIGVPEGGGSPLTAFRFRCVLCGEFIDDITDSGLTQLENGHKRESVFRWIKEK